MTLIKSISGIRGTIGGEVGESLTPIDAVKFAAAYGMWVKSNNSNSKIVIGRDARISGEMISKLVAATLQSVGLDVIDLGLTTTPTVEIAIPMEEAAGGIILTASHNPIQWNALKLMDHNGEFLSSNAGAEILRIAESNEYEFVEVKKLGSYKTDETYLDKHIELIKGLELVDVGAITQANFKIAVDAVNSTGGIAVPRLLKALGVRDITEINCEPDGHFAHNPEPLPENLTQVCGIIEKGHYDLGIVVDPDVDRLALIKEDGNPFGEEYTLVAVADYILANKPGNTVSNLSSSRALKDITEEKGGKYSAAAVGEVHVVSEMKKTNAVIGGEGNGGIIYPELHYGRDALVGIALFLTYMAKSGKNASRIRSGFPDYFISKNKIELTPEINVDQVLDQIKAKYNKQPINTTDGVKIEFDKEWVHLRKSNTEPIIRIYSESDSEATAEHLANKIISDIKDIISTKV